MNEFSFSTLIFVSAFLLLIFGCIFCRYYANVCHLSPSNSSATIISFMDVPLFFNDNKFGWRHTTGYDRNYCMRYLCLFENTKQKVENITRVLCNYDLYGTHYDLSWWNLHSYFICSSCRRYNCFVIDFIWNDGNIYIW